MQKIAIVTGATSFIGRNLVFRLIIEGWDVHIVVRPNSSLYELENLKKQLIVHVHDGTTDNLISIYDKAKPVITFHLAAFTLADHSPSDILPLIESNILFGTQLLEAHYRLESPYFINTGTYWQHYDNKQYSPVCLYAATKEAFEDIVQSYVEIFGLKVITLKLFDTYGPNDTRGKLFSLLTQAYQTNKPLLMSEGEQFVDLVYIDDVIEAYIVAANRLLNGLVSDHESYDISSGNPIKLRKIVSVFENELECKIPIKWGSKPYLKRQIMHPSCRKKKLPGWQAQFDLIRGIRGMNKGIKE